MEASGRLVDLHLAPFEPVPYHASAITLPALREVIQYPEKGQIQEFRREVAVSLKQRLPGAARPIKKRTPLVNSRPSGTLHSTANVGILNNLSKGTKHLRNSSEPEVEADSDARKPKRSCQGHPSLTTYVDQSLQEKEKTKPPFTYAQLALTAILDFPQRSLAIGSIYASIAANHEYYSFMQDTTVWRNSVSHSHRVCKAFERVGQEWQVKAAYGDRTTQTLRNDRFLYQVRFVPPQTLQSFGLTEFPDPECVDMLNFNQFGYEVRFAQPETPSSWSNNLSY